MNDSTPLPMIEPEWALSSAVRVASTTRVGGVSLPPFDSFNLGLHVQDDEVRVRRNRALLSDSLNLPAEPQWLHQVHGTDVCRLTKNQLLEPTQTADASWTDNPGTVIAVVTADCLPVVIANQAQTAVAVAHAGWRGLAAGVLTKVVDQFAADEQLHAWLGPAIGPNAFEVGEDVLSAFTQLNAQHRSAFKPGAAPGKYFADLYQIARAELSSVARITVTGGDHCTYSEASMFFSHRRDGVGSGRMATLAWLA
jgi:YfiH family protein